MEGEGQEREGDQADRYMEELRELIDSSEPAAGGTVVGTTDYSFHASEFQHRLQLRDETSDIQSSVNQSTAGEALDTNYREKLRSYHTSSPSSSRCVNTMMEIVCDGDGSDCSRRQPRQRRELSAARGPISRRSSSLGYMCDVCGEILPSPQSLGGHKNRHRPNKGKNQRRSRASSPVPVVAGDHQGAGTSGSNSSESDSTSVYKGVRCREGNKWVTEIRPPKSKDKWWLGTFPSAEEAAQVYDVALAFFKSESERNFGDHPLYHKFQELPPGAEFAQRLRDRVKDISEQIIAERRSEEQAAAAKYSESRQLPTASPASSSTGAAPSTDPPVLAPSNFTESPPSPPPTPFVWTDLLNLDNVIN